MSEKEQLEWRGWRQTFAFLQFKLKRHLKWDCSKSWTIWLCAVKYLATWYLHCRAHKHTHCKLSAEFYVNSTWAMKNTLSWLAGSGMYKTEHPTVQHTEATIEHKHYVPNKKGNFFDSSRVFQSFHRCSKPQVLSRCHYIIIWALGSHGLDNTYVLYHTLE